MIWPEDGMAEFSLTVELEVRSGELRIRGCKQGTGEESGRRYIFFPMDFIGP